jgi:transketolase
MSIGSRSTGKQEDMRHRRRIVSDDEAIRKKQAEAQKRQQQQQEEESRYEEELRQRQQEYEKEYEQYMEEYQRRKAQMDEIERIRRQELDPDRIGDLFLEKLRARNRIIDADEQQRVNEETEYIKMMQHPNRYSISRMIRELDQNIVIVIRELIDSGKSEAATCIKDHGTNSWICA